MTSLTIIRHFQGKIEGAEPLQKLFFPLSFQGEGDKGGEVRK